MDSALLEREVELAALGDIVRSTQAGQGGLVIIEGDAGVGKSELLVAARASAESAGMHVCSARGSELEQDYGFGVARQLLGDVIGGDEVLAAIRALHDRLRALAAEAPVLVALDDAQWGDDPSLRFLAHVALRIDALPVVLVLTVRPGESTASEPILQRLRSAPGAQLLSPAPLTEAGAAALVSASLGEDPGGEVCAACFRATGGNPFYVSELIRALTSEPAPYRPEQIERVAPRAVLRSVVVRMGRLGDDASRLARAAAVLGDGVPMQLGAELAQIGEQAAESAADALATARILQDGDPLRFVHPLVASALEADMGAFERAREHRRAAELLLAHEAPVERVAAHLMIARPAGDARAVEVLEEAAAHAIASGTPAVAARLLDRALTEPPASEDEGRVLLASVKAQLMAGSTNAAARLEQALGRMAGKENRASALIELATLAHLRWDFGRALEFAARARAELPADDPRQEKLLGIELAAWTLKPDLIDGMEERLEPVMAGARNGNAPADPRLLALVIARLGIEDPPERVWRLAETAITRDPLIDDSHGSSVGWVAGALEWIDELELAERWLSDAVDASRRRGAALVSSIAAGNRARARYFQGRLAAAVSDSMHALELYGDGWSNSPWSTPVLAMSQIAMGDLDAATETIAIGRRGRDGDAPDYGQLLEAEARLQLAAGDPEAALETACAVQRVSEQRFGLIQPRIWEWRRLAALAAHELGDDERALELLEPDLRILRRIGPARQLGHALTVAGLTEGGTKGLELLTEAAIVLESSPARLQRAETLFELGGALRRAGKRSAAKQRLYTALELASEMQAAPLERRVRGELGRLGLRPRRAAQSGVASLTPSERQVADLASDGLSTPQIAARLHVSRNTVETHLRHIYQKLSVSGRRELPGALSNPVEAR